MKKIVIGGLPKENVYHRFCICRKCEIAFLGDIDLEFRKFSSRTDPNDGYYVCPVCGSELSEEYVEVRFNHADE